MNVKKEQELREILTAKCDEAIARGWRIRPNVTYLESNSGGVDCCPLGACMGSNSTEAWDALTAYLGVTDTDLAWFTGAFDGGPGKTNAANLGREFRKKYVK